MKFSPIRSMSFTQTYLFTICVLSAKKLLSVEAQKMTVVF